MHIRFRTPRSAAFTLMEILVVVAIVVVLSSIAYPIYTHFKKKSNKVAATNSIKQLTDGLVSYTNAVNGGILPKEDLDGKDSWHTVKQPTSDKVWYNAVPKHLGQKNAADFSKEGNLAAFYTKENIFYLPGAQYPESRVAKPLFAVAFNSRLSRASVPGGEAAPVKITDVINPVRTVMFVEQGLPGENRAHSTISKKDYDGAPKGSAKSFVTRYSGDEGLMSFFDGHVEPVKADRVLTVTGAIVWSAETANNSDAILWSADPKVNPNTRPEK